ncbi:MAG: hypothetical protein U1C50_00105 [Patescibacteria group bacterium]|nr:hypothetical protein [Patescibacteria group bacterium]
MKFIKANLKFIIPGLLLLIVLAWLFWPSKKTKTTIQEPTKKMEEINKIAIADRPYVTLTPRTDGKEVTLTIDRVTNATKTEYEMEYQTDTLIQGVFGMIDFNEDKLPVSKDLLFGSCSKGKCRYDEGVSGGSLTMRFEGGGEPYALKSDFNLQQQFDREGKFVSKDSKATLDVGRSGLPANTFVLIAGTMGLPTEIEGELIAGPYAFLAASSPALKNATLTIQSKDDLTGAKLMFWNGKTLVDLEAELADGKLSAPVIALGTFLVVK